MPDLESPMRLFLSTFMANNLGQNISNLIAMASNLLAMEEYVQT